jgi:hypothetical protein
MPMIWAISSLSFLYLIEKCATALFRHLHACPDCFRLDRIAGWACTHLSGALVSSGNFQHRGLHFCGSCDGVGMINGHSRLQQTAASAPGGLGSVIAAKTASTYLRFGHRDRDHNPAFSGLRGRTVGPVWKSGNEPSGCTVTHRPRAQALEAPAFWAIAYDAAFITAPSGINPVSR